MKKLMLALLAAFALSACDGGTFQGTAPTVNADPSASPAKTAGRDTKVSVKAEAPVQGKICTEDGGGLEVRPMDRQTSTFINHNTDCTWLAVFTAYGIPKGIVDPAGQHVVAYVYYPIPPGAQKLMDVAYSGCRTDENSAFQTDAWAARRPLQPSDNLIPKVFAQDGVPLHEFGGAQWSADECPGPSYPPQQSPPPVPTCATDPSLCPPPPPPPAPVCTVKGKATFNAEIMQPYDDVTVPPNHVDNLPISIPAGSYHFYADTFDDHATKTGQDQPNEQARFVFKGAGEVGSTGPTVDIPDDKNYQHSDLGVVVLSGDATLVDIIHAGPNNGNPDSLTVVSLSWECVPTTPGPGDLTSAVKRGRR